MLVGVVWGLDEIGRVRSTVRLVGPRKQNGKREVRHGVNSMVHVLASSCRKQLRVLIFPEVGGVGT